VTVSQNESSLVEWEPYQTTKRTSSPQNGLLGRYRPKSFKGDFSDYAAFFV